MDRSLARFSESDQRKMPERRYRTTFDELHVRPTRNPFGEMMPRELRAPPEPSSDRLETMLDNPPDAVLCADAVDQDQFAAGPQHAGAFVKHRHG
jgi:hypothetical protein